MVQFLCVRIKKVNVNCIGFFRSIINEPKLGLVDDVFGYNSLFPLMLRLLPPDSKGLGETLAKLPDPEVSMMPC